MLAPRLGRLRGREVDKLQLVAAHSGREVCVCVGGGGVAAPQQLRVGCVQAVMCADGEAQV